MRLSKIAGAFFIALLGASWLYFRAHSIETWFALSPAYLNEAVPFLAKHLTVTFCHEIHRDGTIATQPACGTFLEKHPRTSTCAFQNLEHGTWQNRVLEADPLRAAENTIEQAKALDCSHLVLDFEQMKDRDAFTRWVQTFAAKVRADGRTLTIAVHAKTDAQGSWEGAAAQDWPALCESADELLLMAYDYHFPGATMPGEQAPLPWVDQVLTYALSACPAAKLRLGLAAYGYKWPSNAVVTEKEAGHAGAPNFVETKDERAEKIKLARARGLKRFFVWALGMTDAL